MDIKKVIIWGIISISLVANVVMVLLLFGVVPTSQRQQEDYRKINFKTLYFRDLFTEKVLLADKEVDFNNRLELEAAVRNLNDRQILDQWQRFTDSETEQEAGIQAKQLLDLLIKKTYLLP